MNRRQWILTGAFAVTGLGVGVGLSYWRHSPKQLAEPAGWVFDLQLQKAAQARGELLALAEFRGKPLVVNFWATWCPPCVEEMPELSAFYDKYKPKGVQLLGIAVDSPSNVREFLEERQFSYPLVVAGANGSELASRLGSRIDAFPYTVLIAPNGQVVQQKMGRIYEEELIKWVEDYI
ncbi:MAG: TlpA family protein disulfide reductase [Burkholderiaceae bacterium]